MEEKCFTTNYNLIVESAANEATHCSGEFQIASLEVNLSYDSKSVHVPSPAGSNEADQKICTKMKHRTD
jgi:hypothetical protein